MQSAFKSYVRTRDYCTTGRHVIQMCLNVIKVSIELGNYVHVNNYISKAEQTSEVQVGRPYTHCFADRSPAILLNSWHPCCFLLYTHCTRHQKD